ncbi:MAG: deoC2 [Devosia sp.]|uniref:deoxyribose-phosphate aldolase n=1 Tax=Devosia sp. TaxID=1871048 RepID=UPI00260181CE|nr:deoxyribose-phosphate aldolase [Devosia sp.]MDB5527134.1 deoC2 [Devosia sp.]
MAPTDQALAAIIDHTILRPEATAADIERYCEEALSHDFKAVCVNPIHVARVVERLKSSGVLTCSVVGFPLGAAPTELKCAEASWAIANGAAEIDMVISIGDLKAGNYDAVRDEIAALKSACGPVCLKVILETSLLTDDEIVVGCRLAQDAGADFVKTSTGFAAQGAIVSHVALMRRTVGPSMGVKASGGIGTRELALQLIAAGASRIGSSNSLKLVG